MSLISSYKLNNPYEYGIIASACADIYDLGCRIYRPKGEQTTDSKVSKLIARAKKYLFPNYEDQIDLFAKVLSWIDNGTAVFNGGMHGALIIDALAIKHIRHKGHGQFCKLLSTTAHVLSYPIAIVFFVLNLLKGSVELTTLSRVNELVERMENIKDSPIKKLEWVNNQYFALTCEDEARIHTFIQAHLPHLSRREKSRRFEEVADKALKVRLDLLKSRISTSLGDLVQSEMKEISKGLNSYFYPTRRAAAERAEFLSESITRQAKNTILIHLLSLTSIALGVISGILVLSATATPPVVIGLAVLSVVFTLMGMYVNRITIQKEASFYLEKLVRWNIIGAKEAKSIALSLSPKAS